MSSRRVRVIRRHHSLITHRIPFEVQPLPPPPTIALRKNFQGALTKSTRKPARHLPALVPIAVSGRNTPAKSSRVENDARPEVQQTTIVGDGAAADADDSESDLSDVDSPSDIPNMQQASNSPSKIPKPPGEAGRPKSGGFNLEEMLCWPKEDFNTIQVRHFN